MLFDLIDLTRLRRAIVYAIVLAVVFVVQDLIVSHITLLGVKPMLVPAVVAAVGLFDGAPWGGFIGLAAGYFADMGYSEQVILFTVLFPMLGLFSGVLGKYMLHKGFLSFVALFLVSMGIITICQMFPFLFSGTRIWVVWRTGIIQILWSLPWAMPIYFPCRSIASRSLTR